MFYAQLSEINWEFHGKTIDTICVNWYYYKAVRTDLNSSWRQIDDYVILIIGSVCGNSSAVEHRLAKAGVASSNLVSRSIHSSIAQLVEQSAVNRSVVGSSPTRGAIHDSLAQLAEHLTFNQGVPRSSRGWVTISGPLVKRLRHRPFTAVSRVRFPDGSPHGRLAQLGERLPYKQDVGSSILSSSTNVSGYLRITAFCYITQ